MLVVRDEHVLTAAEADGIRAGDYAYFLAPPEKAQALDRFFVDMPPPVKPDLRLLGDFFVSGDVSLGTLGEIYGLTIAPKDEDTTLADWFAAHFGHRARVGDRLRARQHLSRGRRGLLQRAASRPSASTSPRATTRSRRAVPRGSRRSPSGCWRGFERRSPEPHPEEPCASTRLEGWPIRWAAAILETLASRAPQDEV